MRLGGPVFVNKMTPEKWISALKQAGYGAAYCPVNADSTKEVIQAYATAAKAANIVIAEVGAWSNPLSPNQEERTAALEKCKVQLALADQIGAKCCVNISGSRGTPWDGPHRDNLTKATFDMIVNQVREIIDAVNPQRAVFALEPMPWMYPDTADNYLDLIEQIDRPQFAVHIDMVNVINSPRRYYQNADLIYEWFSKLAPFIVSCHAKDTLISSQLTTHLDEVRPGLGELDYRTMLREIDKLHPDTPLMIEHLHTAEEYTLSAAYIRRVAEEIGVAFVE
ncbi:MAG: sugar phosphate isomerase/epimerase [Anaerolineae bacterium]|nr:sugar phosphate isomerase/epimerase [Anaerolineae bacterium]